MKYIRLLIERNLILILAIASLIMCLISFSVLFRAIRLNEKPVIIAIDLSGRAHLVTKEEDPLMDKDAIQFVRDYFSNKYNVSSETFEKNYRFVTNHMGSKLWEREKGNVSLLREKMSNNQLNIEGFLEKISKEKDGIFVAEISLTASERIGKVKHKVEATVVLSKTNRTSTNPEGIEVIEYVEKIIE
jgi:hypothetical protein